MLNGSVEFDLDLPFKGKQLGPAGQLLHTTLKRDPRNDLEAATAKKRESSSWRSLVRDRVVDIDVTLTKQRSSPAFPCHPLLPSG